MEEEKQQKFRQALRDVKNLPTLPAVVMKLTKMAEDPDVTTEQMGRVISKDHILGAKLLKLVNSAFYGFPQRVSSLQSAIILLGFSVIKSLIISASIFEFMEDNDRELWEHSLGCAVVCNVLARRLQVSDPEEISTAGLIHDIGKVAIKMELPQEYREIEAMVHDRRISMREAETEVLGFNHAEVGGWLAKTWNLPSKLVEPVAMHHNPSGAKKEKMAAAIVHVGDIIIRCMGLGHGEDVWVPGLEQRAWQLLHLTAADVDEILVEVEEKLWEVKGFSLDIMAEFEAKAD